MNIPNMLLVGSTARNVGKTSFCLEFISKWKNKYDIVGLKVTTVDEGMGICHHGDGGCGACSELTGRFEITEEVTKSPKKDTGMLLEAGAKKVFWIKTLRGFASEAFDAVKANLSEDSVIICESNVLAEFIKPGAAVLMQRSGACGIKPSAAAFREKADFICDISEQSSVETALKAIKVTFENGKVKIFC